MSETPVYEERQRMFLRPVLMLVMVAVFGIGAWHEREQTGALISLLVVLPMVLLLIWGFTELRIVVTPTEVRFGFPLYRKRVHVSRLTVGDVERIPFMAGIGVHSWAGRWVFNAKLGRGVKVIVGRVQYLIGSDQPERLQSALLQVAPRRMTP